jgi:ArsR family transcriptional regulator
MLSKADHFAADLAALAAQAKALAHPARLAILQTLAARDTCICGDLVDDLPLAQASVSRHLKTLKDAGLINGEIDGPRTCYCLDREAVASLYAELGPFFENLLATPSCGDCC